MASDLAVLPFGHFFSRTRHGLSLIAFPVRRKGRASDLEGGNFSELEAAEARGRLATKRHRVVKLVLRPLGAEVEWGTVVVDGKKVAFMACTRDASAEASFVKGTCRAQWQEKKSVY